MMNSFALIFVLSGLVSALLIALDLRRNRQSMKIMNSVWVLTGLWSGVFGFWAYFWFGREEKGKTMVMPKNHDTPQPMHMDHPMSGQGMDMRSMDRMDASMKHEMMGSSGGMMMSMHHRPKWQSVVLSTLHCGAGCTLADLIGEWFLYFIPVALGGSLLLGGWALDYILALGIGVYFQYTAIRSMQTLSKSGALTKAFKADVLSLTAWQVGMYGWMAVVTFVLFQGETPLRTSWTFWFMMQVAMGCGFVVALPMNLLLIRLGIKKGM